MTCSPHKRTGRCARWIHKKYPGLHGAPPEFNIVGWRMIPTDKPQLSGIVLFEDWRVPTPTCYAPLPCQFTTLASVGRFPCMNMGERVFPSGNLWSLLKQI